MQFAVNEYARSILGLQDVNSTEISCGDKWFLMVLEDWRPVLLLDEDTVANHFVEGWEDMTRIGGLGPWDVYGSEILKSYLIPRTMLSSRVDGDSHKWIDAGNRETRAVRRLHHSVQAICLELYGRSSHQCDQSSTPSCGDSVFLGGLDLFLILSQSNIMLQMSVFVWKNCWEGLSEKIWTTTYLDSEQELIFITQPVYGT
ncbi:hypothetical protein KY289_034331 [Solanum tuberosum]|nr:hypothetical protein KY289_034331 [Solanum tuberosum]